MANNQHGNNVVHKACSCLVWVFFSFLFVVIERKASELYKPSQWQQQKCQELSKYFVQKVGWVDFKVSPFMVGQLG